MLIHPHARRGRVQGISMFAAGKEGGGGPRPFFFTKNVSCVNLIHIYVIKGKKQILSTSLLDFFFL